MALSIFVTPAVLNVYPALAQNSLSALDGLNVLVRSLRAQATRPLTGFATSLDEANAAWLTSLEDNDLAEHSSDNRIALVRLFDRLIRSSDPEDGTLAVIVDLNQIPAVRRLRSKMTEYILQDLFPACINMVQQGHTHAGFTLLEPILTFIEHAIADLDLKSLIDPTFATGSRPIPSTPTDPLDLIQQHPGFTALRRLLTDETLREAVFTAARVKVAEGLPDNVPTALFDKISHRAINVLRNVMARQTIFLEVIVPSIRHRTHDDSASWASGNMLPIDWYLAHQPSTISQIASFVSADVSDGLAASTIEFLRDLGRSVHMRVPFLSGGATIQGNLLAYVFKDAPNSSVVLAGFVDRLERGESESTATVETLPSRLVDYYDEGTSTQMSKPSQQSLIMDLLLENTLPERGEVTFAHFLLGFLDPGAPGSGLVKTLLRDGPQAGTIVVNGQVTEMLHTIPRTCFHVIVDHLSSRLPTLDQTEESDPDPIIASSPELGYKCVQLLRQLVQSDMTGQMTARYLRGQEDLVRRSLVYLPVTPASTGSGNEQGIAAYGDGTTIGCEANEMVFFLRYQAEVLHLASLELYLLESSSSEAVHITQALFQRAPVNVSPIRGILALTVLACLDFSWQINSSEPNAAGFETINFNAFQTVDYEGASVYACGELDRVMRLEIERLQRKSPSVDRTSALDVTRQEVLAYLRRENGKARIANSVRLALEAWATSVTAVLTKTTAGSVEPAVNRQIMFDLSSACLASLLSPAMQVPQKAEILASVLLSLSSALSRTENANTGVKRGGLPVDRLQVILSDLVQAIADGEISELARGLLYSTLTDYLKLIRGYAINVAPTHTEAIQWMIAVLQPVYADLDRLLSIVGRDALNGSLDWQLVSYTLLTEIVTVFEDKTDSIVTGLRRRGLLQNFLAAIRVADLSIQSVFSAEAGE